MTLYIFRIDDGETQDTAEVELADTASARIEAVRYLGALLNDAHAISGAPRD